MNNPNIARTIHPTKFMLDGRVEVFVLHRIDQRPRKFLPLDHHFSLVYKCETEFNLNY